MASKRMVFGPVLPEIAEEGDQFTSTIDGKTYTFLCGRWTYPGWPVPLPDEPVPEPPLPEGNVIDLSNPPAGDTASEPKPKKKTTRSKKTK